MLLVFLVFVYRGTKIAILAYDPALTLLAGDLSAGLALQTIIVGGVTKTTSLSDLGLPFVSYGGSAVVSNFVVTGLLLVISERAGRQSLSKRKMWGTVQAEGALG